MLKELSSPSKEKKMPYIIALSNSLSTIYVYQEYTNHKARKNLIKDPSPPAPPDVPREYSRHIGNFQGKQPHQYQST